MAAAASGHHGGGGGGGAYAREHGASFGMTGAQQREMAERFAGGVRVGGAGAMPDAPALDDKWEMPDTEAQARLLEARKRQQIAVTGGEQQLTGYLQEKYQAQIERAKAYEEQQKREREQVEALRTQQQQQQQEPAQDGGDATAATGAPAARRKPAKDPATGFGAWESVPSTASAAANPWAPREVTPEGDQRSRRGGDARAAGGIEYGNDDDDDAGGNASDPGGERDEDGVSHRLLDEDDEADSIRMRIALRTFESEQATRKRALGLAPAGSSAAGAAKRAETGASSSASRPASSTGTALVRPPSAAPVRIALGRPLGAAAQPAVVAVKAEPGAGDAPVAPARRPVSLLGFTSGDDE